MLKNDAFDRSVQDWEAWLKEEGLPRYRAKQLIQWIYQKGVLNPEEFNNIGKKERERLLEAFSWELPEVDSHLKSSDRSEKFLLKTHDALLIEMVLMPYENRATLCVSSQVGCKMGCTFCQTGKMGLKRDLSSGEILAQILIANRHFIETGRSQRVTNVVFMGMGEPLDNYDEVVKACRLMVDPNALGLSKSRVTVSTSGLVPEIERLGRELPVRLAISLHTANNEKRSKMMPVNRTYSLADLKKVLLTYPSPARYGVTFEYVMIQGENDSIADAKKLVHFLHGIKAKVNLIPLNHFPGMPMKSSDAERIRAFQKYLADRSIPSPVRYSRGQDVSGGCGQLAAKRQDELDMDPRLLAKQRRQQERSSFALFNGN